MTTNHKFLGNLGDSNYLDNGGFMVFEDENGGGYAEIIHSPACYFGKDDLSEEMDEFLLSVNHQIVKLMNPVVDLDIDQVEEKLFELIEDEIGEWEIYRVSLDKCYLTDGILSNNPLELSKHAWFARPEEDREKHPKDIFFLSVVCDYVDSLDYDENGKSPVEQMQADLCSDDIMTRARAYNAIYDYHDYDNGDANPLKFYWRKEVRMRYFHHILNKAAENEVS